MVLLESAGDLWFAKPPPTGAELYDRCDFLPPERAQHTRLYFRSSRDESYIGVTPNCLLQWRLYQHREYVYYAYLARPSPSGSPEWPPVPDLALFHSPCARSWALLSPLSFVSSYHAIYHLLNIVDVISFSLSYWDPLTPLFAAFKHLDMTLLSGWPPRELLSLDALGDMLISHIRDSWHMHQCRGERRNTCVLTAGDGSEALMTNLAAALPHVLLAAARRRADMQQGLIEAFEQCVMRQLVLQIAIPSIERIQEQLLRAYLSPPRTASTARYAGNTNALHAGGGCVWRFIALQEESWRPYSGTLAVIVHFDAVHQMVQKHGSEREAAAQLGTLLFCAANMWSVPGLFPIFYVSGLCPVVVQDSASLSRLTKVKLPPLHDVESVSDAQFIAANSNQSEPCVTS